MMCLFRARLSFGVVQEQFTRTFDVFPFEQPRHPQSTMDPSTMAETKKLASSTTGAVYGFGSASLRFQNEVYGCHLSYGKVNKAVIELEPTEPVSVQNLGPAAPSMQLPEFAAKFKPPLGRTFATTVSRDAPPGHDGKQQFWVQPKDTGGLFPGGDEPEIFAMNAPRGSGPPSTMHAVPTQLLTPAERREALVFDKCHQRARLALRKAANDACQLTRVMQQRFPNGVIGLEGPGSQQSTVYEADRNRRESEAARKAGSAAQRFENISTRRDSQLDYRLLTHDHKNSTVDPMFPRKAASSIGVRGAPTSATDAHGNYNLRPSGFVPEFGFRSNQEQPNRAPSAARAATLHNVGTRGKPYDIITGVTLPIQPLGLDPSLFSQDRRAHPSNISMPHRGGTAPTLIGPIPDAHASSWQPPSPQKSPSRQYMK